MKPEPYRLDPQTYRFTLEVPTRFGDLDPLGHVNNVAIGSFYEEGRAKLNRITFPTEMRKRHSMRMLMADLHIAYLGEAHYPEPLIVYSGISHIGRSSYTIAQALFQEGQCVGTAESVLVNTDGTAPAPLPAEAIEALKAYALNT